MFATLALLLAVTFAESKTLALQIHLDRAGFSCNTIDGVWGRKGARALAGYLRASRDARTAAALSGATPDAAYDALFANEPDPFRLVTVTEADLAALVTIPEDAAAKSELPRMGYESVREMIAERGHLSQIALARMNPGVDWKNVQPGLKLVIPDFPPIEDEFKAADRGRPNRPKRPDAALVRVSLASAEVTVWDAAGRLVALFPCSVAARKAKVPPHGELKVTSYVAWPNFTYTPDTPSATGRLRRFVWPSGENCPVGVAWLGLNLPGYGIHGTPRPESIGFTGSHGCFRLANWNAARLYAMCRSGTKVLIEP